jgi:DNA-binding transcriptional ArsR family regulator
VPEQKYQAVLAVLSDGRSVSELAEQWGVSRQSVHAWLRRYEDEGLVGLAPRSGWPASCSNQLGGVVEARILELRRVHPGWGPRRILYDLQHDQRLADSPDVVAPSRSGIYRALVRTGMIDPAARRRRDEHWRRWERAEPMGLCQMWDRWTWSAGSSWPTGAARRR